MLHVLLVSIMYIFILLNAFLQIIPPGMEFHHIVPVDGDMDGETEGNEDHQSSPDPPIWSEVLMLLNIYFSWSWTDSIYTTSF